MNSMAFATPEVPGFISVRKTNYLGLLHKSVGSNNASKKGN